MGPAVIAFAALALQLGAEKDEVDELFGRMGATVLPTSPSEAIEQIEKTLEKMRDGK